FVVRDALSQHVARSSSALLDGVLPMFDPDPAIEDWVIVIRDVTGGVNAADVGLAILVDDHAVVELNAAVSERFDRRLDPHAYDDGSTTGNHFRPDAIGVLYRTKTVNAVQIDAGNRHGAVAPARGDEQCVERHATMILKLHDAR